MHSQWDDSLGFIFARRNMKTKAYKFGRTLT